jgi:hypothetical protein
MDSGFFEAELDQQPEGLNGPFPSANRPAFQFPFLPIKADTEVS